MAAQQFYSHVDPADRVIVADVVAQDVKKRIVLLVEVEAQGSVNNGIDGLLYKLPEAPELIPFAMIVDLENIQIFQWDGANLSEPICSLKSSDILSHYQPSFGSQRIFYDYLRRLVESWLRDLAYHWKTEIPPASEQIAAIGLLPLLEDGTTKTDVVLFGDVEDYADSLY